MSQSEDPVTLQVVARVRSPYKEKFGIPRQPGLVPSARGRLQLLEPYTDPAMLDGLEGFSHLWLIFGFHACVAQGWRPRVRPPRLGGNREVGVFASRSPFRPNHLGLSVVEYLGVETGESTALLVAGLDLLDGTPVYDIKPYVPYVDALPDALGGFASTQPEQTLQVCFSATAQATLDSQADAAWLRSLIEESLTLDPRPAYRRGAESDRVYGMRLDRFDVRWRVTGAFVEVVALNEG